jgi:hypothetical protein
MHRNLTAAGTGIDTVWNWRRRRVGAAVHVRELSYIWVAGMELKSFWAC